MMNYKNYIVEYHNKIQSGKIVASKKIKRIYEMIMPIIEGKSDKWYYNETLANRPIAFIENYCKQSTGRWGGKPLKLLLFQKAKIQAIFGIVGREDNLRKYQEVFDLRSRKNGKSTENAAIALYLLVVDNEQGAEIYSAATTREQAKKVWEEAQMMVAKDRELSSFIKTKLYPSGELSIEKTNSKFTALSKNVKAYDGLNTHGAIIDEVHALARDIYDLIVQSTTARLQPLISMITTSGFVREGLFDDIYAYATRVLDGVIEDDRFLPLIYELDEEMEMYDENMWIKANPALDTIKDREFLRRNILKMEGDPNFANTVKVKDFNIIGVDNLAWLTYDTLNNDTVVDTSKYNGGIAIGGLDLSRTGDLTAFSTAFYDSELDKFVFETMYWLPEEKFRELENGKIPYRQWVDRGLIRLCKGNTIDYQMVSDYIYKEMAIDRDITYMKIHYDAYSAVYLIKELESLGFSDRCLIRTQQGYKTLSIPMQTLEQELKNKRVIYQNNPITKWCLSNVELMQDRNGNYMPKKVDDKYERKIDGAATMINCFVGIVENYESFVNY